MVSLVYWLPRRVRYDRNSPHGAPACTVSKLVYEAKHMVGEKTGQLLGAGYSRESRGCALGAAGQGWVALWLPHSWLLRHAASHKGLCKLLPSPDRSRESQEEE